MRAKAEQRGGAAGPRRRDGPAPYSRASRLPAWTVPTDSGQSASVLLRRIGAPSYPAVSTARRTDEENSTDFTSRIAEIMRSRQPERATIHSRSPTGRRSDSEARQGEDQTAGGNPMTLR